MSKKITFPECANCGEQSANNKKCGRCNAIHYCQKMCQRQDWHLHKPNCIAPENRGPKPEAASSEPECSICLEVMYEATTATLPCCANSLCFECVDSVHRCAQSCPFCREAVPSAMLHVDAMQQYLLLRKEMYGENYILADDNPDIWFQRTNTMKERFNVVYRMCIVSANLGQPGMCSFLAGEIYYRHFEEGDSEQWARKALAFHDIEGHVILSKIYKKRLDFATAESHIRLAIALDPSTAKYFELGDVLLRKYSSRPHCDEDAALVAETESVLMKSLEGNRIDYLTYNALFTLMSGCKKWERAISFASKSLEMHDNPSARVGYEYATAVMLITDHPQECRRRIEAFYEWDAANITSLDLLYVDVLLLTNDSPKGMELLRKTLPHAKNLMLSEVKFRLDAFTGMPNYLIPILIKAKYDPAFATLLTKAILTGPNRSAFESAMAENPETYEDALHAVLRS